MILETSMIDSTIFCEIKEVCKKIFLADLLGSQYLFENSHTSNTVENSENVVIKGVCFGKLLQWSEKMLIFLKLIRPVFV